MANNGKAYEKLVQDIYQAILNEETDNIEVKHDITIEVAEGLTHQVDVYWRFLHAGIEILTVVECKDWKNRIPRKEVDAFIKKVSDLNANIGIFVSTTGFQSGAIKQAERSGIQLIEVREPWEEDWEGRIQTIVFQMTVTHPLVENLHVIVDESMVNQSPSYFHKDGKKSLNEQLCFYDVTLDKTLDLQGIAKETKGGKIPLDEQFHVKRAFESGSYMITSHGNTYIVGVTFDYSESEQQMPDIVLDGKKTARAIIKDVKTGKIRFFNKNNTLGG